MISYEMHSFFKHINSPNSLSFVRDHMSMICQQSNQISSSLEKKIFETDTKHEIMSILDDMGFI